MKTISMMKTKKTKINAYAKVNLTLEVLGKRPDGYHALRSLVAMISLHDEIEVELDETISSDTGYADDLCVKAARVLADSAAKPLGAKIRVKKSIPVGGGLGGGSADAAAVLIALNELWELKYTREQLAELGAAVGSDVPSLVIGGFVVMEGRGEIVERIHEFDSKAPLYLVLVNPGVFCSTKEVYALCKSSLHSDAEILYNMQNALRSEKVEEVAKALQNDLEPPAKALHPEIVQAMEELKRIGAKGVLMSGSGSTVFGLVESEARGREIAELMKAKGFWSQCVHTIVR